MSQPLSKIPLPAYTRVPPRAAGPSLPWSGLAILCAIIFGLDLAAVESHRIRSEDRSLDLVLKATVVVDVRQRVGVGQQSQLRLENAVDAPLTQ